jgi:chaperonin cofactor prefoldin
MPAPTQGEFDQLKKRVNRLEKQIEEYERRLSALESGFRDGNR